MLSPLEIGAMQMEHEDVSDEWLLASAEPSHDKLGESVELLPNMAA